MHPYSRPDTWQWRHFRMKNKPFFLELGAGEHKVSIQSNSRIYAVAFSEKSDIYLEPYTTDKALVMKVSDAKRTGNGWKVVAPEKAFLRLIPVNGKPEKSFVKKIFNTRFHGQLQVCLPQGIFSKSGETVEFLTLAYPAEPGKEQPVVKDGKVIWNKAVDEIIVNGDHISIRRVKK